MSNYAFTWSSGTPTKLRAGLEGLTGYDYGRAEREERQAGNKEAALVTSGDFLARLASYALKVPVPEIKGLPIQKYLQLQAEVMNFLNGGLVEEKAPEDSTDELPFDVPSTEALNIGAD